MPRRKPTNRGGRPSKFTTPAVVAITGALIAGESFEAAAHAAGIGQSTLYRWLAKARAGDPRFGPLADVVRQARHAGQHGSAFSSLAATLIKRGWL
jgi:hypothetical protein